MLSDSELHISTFISGWKVENFFPSSDGDFSYEASAVMLRFEKAALGSVFHRLGSDFKAWSFIDRGHYSCFDFLFFPVILNDV